MILRAWHNWFGFVKSNRTHRRRVLSAFPVERLESRCLLAATVNGTSTNPRITLSGSESITISDNGTNLTFSLGSGTSGTLGGSLGSLSTLTVTGSSSSNPMTINLSAGNGLSSSFRVIVNGNNGNDMIDASGSDFSVILNGGSGTDTLIGGTANDTLNGSSNNDTLIGGAGDDDLNGGSGNDEISGDEGEDLCLGDAGNDNISGGEGNDNVNGQAGDDVVVGDDGNDYVFGGAGRDFIDGGDGTDVVKGQGGRDTITGSLDDARAEADDFRFLGSDTWRNNLGNAGSPNLDPRDTRSEYEGG